MLDQQGPGDSELDELCAAYWSYYRARRMGDERTADALWWAWERVDAIGLGRSGAESTEPVRVLVALAEHAGDDLDALAFLGAGPIEDYLNSDHFDDARTEQAALSLIHI